MGILPAGGRPYFFNGVVMGKEKLEILWKKLVNRETVSYLIFGVLTTLVDWIVYPVLRWLDYSVAVSSAGSWAAAVLFAFVTNKLFVFQSYTFRPGALAREFISFVSCRALSGVFTIGAMVVIVDVMGWNEWLGKVAVSALSLVLNYIFSKLFIFKKPKNRGEEI